MAEQLNTEHLQILVLVLDFLELKAEIVLYSLRAVHQLLLLAKIRVVFVSGLPRGGKGGLPGNWIAACLFSSTRSLFGTRTIWHISRNLCR